MTSASTTGWRARATGASPARASGAHRCPSGWCVPSARSVLGGGIECLCLGHLLCHPCCACLGHLLRHPCCACLGASLTPPLLCLPGGISGHLLRHPCCACLGHLLRHPCCACLGHLLRHPCCACLGASLTPPLLCLPARNGPLCVCVRALAGAFAALPACLICSPV